MNIFEQYESEVRSYCRNYPVVFEYAKNEIMTDENGKSYIDFFAGAGALNYGHNNDYIKGKLIDYLQEDRIIHSLDMYATAKRDFIDFFENEVLKPRGLDYKLQFVAPTGANAVEAALKLARKVKQRPGVFALMGCFHGMTMGALSLTSDADSRAGAGVPLHYVTHIPAPYMFPELDTIKYIETILTDDHSGIARPAAFVVEPIQSDGGVYPLGADFLRRLRELCDKYDILLIADDIQVGSCRSGSFFSFEEAGIVPDIVTISKSLGGYGLPCSLVLLKPELDIWKPGEHNGTFRGNQLSFVAAKAGLEFMIEHDVPAMVRAKEPIVREFLEKEILPLDSRIEVRGVGLMWGIDLNAIPGAAKALVSECFQNGVIAERAGRGNNVLKLMPPLIISEENLKKGLEIVKKSLIAVLAECR